MLKIFLNNLNWRFEKELGIVCRKGISGYFLYKIKKYKDDERGAGVIELVLILVVLIGFVVIFKDKIKSLLDTIYSKINSQASSLYA